MSVKGRSRAVAAVIVLAIHGATAWVLLRTPIRHGDGAAERPVLRVRWIERTRPEPQAAARPAPAASTPSFRRPAPLPEKHRAPAQQAAVPLPAEAVAPAPVPDYLAQGAAWAADTAPPVDFQPGLTSSRIPVLPGGANGGQFRMREPTSPRRTVEKTIGWLFGGPNYTTDPCPRMHDNVHGLLPDSSDEGRRHLAWELQQYRERCRP